MKLAFDGLLIGARPAKDQQGNVKQGSYKLKFLDMATSGEFEVTTSVLPEDKVRFIPLSWALEVMPKIYNGLIKLEASAVHGEAPRVSSTREGVNAK